MLSELKAQLHQLRGRQESAGVKLDAAFFDFYTRIVPRLVGAERCSIFISDPQSQSVWLKAGTGVAERDIAVPAAESIVGQVISERKPLIVADMEERPGVHKQVDAETGFQTRNVLCVPIFGHDGGKPVGAIQILNKKDGAFGAEDVATAEDVAQQIATNVELVYLNQEMFGIAAKLMRTAWWLMSGAAGLAAVVIILGILFLAGLAAAPAVVG